MDKDKILETTKRLRWAKTHPEEAARLQREFQRKLRLKAIEKLGSKCTQCGESDIRCLQFDHINGGGTKEHLENNRNKFLRSIINGERLDIQWLCANCNWKKKWNNNEVSNKKWV